MIELSVGDKLKSLPAYELPDDYPSIEPDTIYTIKFIDGNSIVGIHFGASKFLIHFRTFGDAYVGHNNLDDYFHKPEKVKKSIPVLFKIPKEIT